MLRSAMYKVGLERYGEVLGQHCGFVAVSPLIVRLCDETGMQCHAVATDKNLIECGLSQEPLITQWKMDADPFDSWSALWVLGRCAYEDAERWLAEFSTAGLTAGPALWLAVQLDYSLGTGATRRVLGLAKSVGRLPDLVEWLPEFADVDATKPHFSGWWGRCPPALAAKRMKRAVRRLADALDLGSLDARIGDDIAPPSKTLPAGYSAMPGVLRRVCERLERLRKSGQLTPEIQEEEWEGVREYARTRKRAARLPKIAWVASKLTPVTHRHPEAALVRRAA